MLQQLQHLSELWSTPESSRANPGIADAR